MTGGYEERIVNLAAEHGLISILLQNPELIVDTTVALQNSDFAVPAAKAMYSLIQHLSIEGQSLDSLRIMTEAEHHDHIYRAIGGEQGYGNIEALRNMDVDPKNLKEFIETIKKHSVARQLVTGSEQLRQRVIENYQKLSITELMGLIQQLEMKITNDNRLNQSKAKSIADGLDELIEGELTDVKDVIGYRTLYPSLDKITLGLQPAECYTIVGRPGDGKSTVLKCLGTRLGIMQNVGVYYIDTEMVTETQQWRILSELSGVPEHAIKLKQHLTRPDWKAKLDKARKEMLGSKFYHAEINDFTIEQLINMSRQAVANLGAQVIIFDYIKLPDSGSVEKEHVFLGNVTSALKNSIAKELDVSVITAAQTKQDDPFAIADSDRIKRYSTFVGVWAECVGKHRNKGSHRLFITKNRFGFVDQSIYFNFNKPYLRITEADNTHLKDMGNAALPLGIAGDGSGFSADDSRQNQSNGSDKAVDGEVRSKCTGQWKLSLPDSR